MRGIVAKLEGYPISEEEFDGWVALADSLAPGGKPSMRQDGEAHRKSEVELFAGTMVRLGRKHGVEVPVNAWLYEKVKENEELLPHHTIVLETEWEIGTHYRLDFPR